MKTIVLIALLTFAFTLQSCVPAPPRVYVSETSPDRKSLAYIMEYYASVFHYPVPVYPKYRLVVRRMNQELDLYNINLKEFNVTFAMVAWSDDSSAVGFYMNAWNSNPLAKAFDTKSRREVPFATVENVMRRQMIERWARFIPLGSDPLSVAKNPSDELSKAFYNWRIKRFEARPTDKPR